MDPAYARSLASQVARYLKDRYGARKVFIFGPLVTGAFNPDSSVIDVGFVGAKEDLSSDANADAASDCKLHFSHRDADGLSRLRVINLSEADAETRNRILQEAEEL